MSARAVRRLVPIAGVVLVAAAYLIQVRSPLRLHFDTVVLLRMADSFRAGRGFSPPELNSPHPIGFPALVALLLALHVASAPVLVLVNDAAVAIGLLCSFHYLRTGLFAGTHQAPVRLSRRTRLVICLLTATSWVLFKHAVIPITDVVYFGVSSLTLLVLVRAWQRPPEGRPKSAVGPCAWVALGSALAACSILTRTVGITLLPAVGWAALGQGGPSAVFEYFRRRRALLAMLLLGALVLAVPAVIAVAHNKYVWDFATRYSSAGSRSLAGVLQQTFLYRLADMGEIVPNVSSQAFSPVAQSFFPAHAALASTALSAALLLAGLVGYVLIALGFWAERRTLSPAAVYFLAYTALLLIWPYRDPRFHLPCLPLIFGTAALGLMSVGLQERRSAALWAYVVGFLLLGCGAVAHTTRLTFAGDRFADSYSDQYTDSYKAAYGLPHDDSKVDPEAVRLLREYDPRAALPAEHGPGEDAEHRATEAWSNARR